MLLVMPTKITVSCVHHCIPLFLRPPLPSAAARQVDISELGALPGMFLAMPLADELKQQLTLGCYCTCLDEPHDCLGEPRCWCTHAVQAQERTRGAGEGAVCIASRLRVRTRIGGGAGRWWMGSNSRAPTIDHRVNALARSGSFTRTRIGQDHGANDKRERGRARRLQSTSSPPPSHGRPVSSSRNHIHVRIPVLGGWAVRA